MNASPHSHNECIEFMNNFFEGKVMSSCSQTMTVFCELEIHEWKLVTT